MLRYILEVITMENHKFYSIGQVAQLLGVSDRTIRRLVWKGDLEAIKVGKSVRIASEYIEIYTNKNKFKNGEGQPQIKLSESEISLKGMFKDGKLIPKEDANEVWNDKEHPKKDDFRYVDVLKAVSLYQKKILTRLLKNGI